MSSNRKRRIPSLRGALEQFRLECAREIEILGRFEENSKDDPITGLGSDEDRPREN